MARVRLDNVVEKDAPESEDTTFVAVAGSVNEVSLQKKPHSDGVSPPSEVKVALSTAAVLVIDVADPVVTEGRATKVVNFLRSELYEVPSEFFAYARTDILSVR